MSTFHTARHSAHRTHRTAAHRAGAGILAATALGLGASMMTATSAAAQGGPEGPTSSTSSTSTASAPSADTSNGSSSFSDVVRVGDRGSVVEKIQDKVGVPADGVFGSETEQAVTSWQADHGLSADGVVGTETGSEMGLSSGSTTSTASSTETATTSTASTSETVPASTSSPASDSSIVESARALIGTPYVMGGTSTSGFDCSGLVQHVYKTAGKDVPRTTQEQQAAATPVSDPQPGDIVFFGNPAYHNGIYAGDGKIIDAGNPGTGVTERDIWTDDVSYGRF